MKPFTLSPFPPKVLMGKKPIIVTAIKLKTVSPRKRRRGGKGGKLTKENLINITFKTYSAEKWIEVAFIHYQQYSTAAWQTNSSQQNIGIGAPGWLR